MIELLAFVAGALSAPFIFGVFKLGVRLIRNKNAKAPHCETKVNYLDGRDTYGLGIMEENKKDQV